jgi:hypothetical protein
MRYVKWTLLAIVALIVFLFFNYTLPSHVVVRIVETNSQRMDMGMNGWFYAAPDTGTNGSNKAGTGRDIKFIQTIKPNGRPLVFRNEDTGWGWPPYFKVNSFDLQTEASNLKSTKAEPQWVMVTYYGWRSRLLTIFPNAVRIRAVSGPDASVFPWATVIILGTLAVILLLVRRAWIRFRRRRIAPVLEDVSDVLDEADDRAKGVWRRLIGR